MIEAQKTTLNSDERRWLDRATKLASEPNLKDRIEDLFSRLPWRIESSSLAKFADECAHRRNDLSHHGGPRGNGEHAYEIFLRQLMTLSRALSILYHAALLQKIGVDDQTLQLPLECNPVRTRLRLPLAQAELNSRRSMSLPSKCRRLRLQQRTEFAATTTDSPGGRAKL